jgi:two-component system, LuxR family, sensor kinase FixL
MQWVDKLFRPQDLRHCIRNLITLSTLPAIWRNYQPQQIAEGAAAALLAILDADFVHGDIAGRYE